MSKNVQTLSDYLDRTGDRTKDAKIVREFSDRFGVSISTVYRLLQEESAFVYKDPAGSLILLRKAAECDSRS